MRSLDLFWSALFLLLVLFGVLALGWVNILSFNPRGNDDVRAQLDAVLKLRPFKDRL